MKREIHRKDRQKQKFFLKIKFSQLIYQLDIKKRKSRLQGRETKSGKEICVGKQ